MKLSSYLYQGKKSYGILTDTGIIDLGRRIGEQYIDLKALLTADALTLAKNYVNDPIDFAEKEVVFLPVIESPNKILCVGMNYAAKREEFNESNPAPTLFIRFADSQVGHEQPVLKPRHSQEFDYEGELAIVIGKGGREISAQQAKDHIAGFSCYMDGSARDWQHSWFTAGKNWPQTGAFGPCLATAESIADPQKLAIATYLNGVQVQEDNTQNMMRDVYQLVEYISTFTPLSAGDVILTGSPGGVGKKRTPPLFMKEGDRIEVVIESIGRLSNVIKEAKV